jgi:hypothetical protein
MSEVKFLSDVQSLTTGTRAYDTPFGRVVDIVRVAEIDGTLRTTWPLIERSGQGDRADVSSASITIPSGSTILMMGLRIAPTVVGGSSSGLVATTSDRLKISNAVANNTLNGQNANGTQHGVASAAAASSTFAPATALNEWRAGEDNASVARLNTNVTYTLFNDNGSTALGSGVRSATGTITLVMVRIKYLMADVVPLPQQAAAYPAKRLSGITYIPNF